MSSLESGQYWSSLESNQCLYSSQVNVFTRVKSMSSLESSQCLHQSQVNVFTRVKSMSSTWSALDLSDMSQHIILTSNREGVGGKLLDLWLRTRLESDLLDSADFLALTFSFLFPPLRLKNLLAVAGEGGVNSSTGSLLSLGSSPKILSCSIVRSFLILSISIFCTRCVSKKRSFAIPQVSFKAKCTSFSCSSSLHTRGKNGARIRLSLQHS